MWLQLFFGNKFLFLDRCVPKVVDGLAKHDLGLDVSCKIFDVVPGFISLVVVADNASVMFPKGF